jgi:SAM-dependent methyltransferase
MRGKSRHPPRPHLAQDFMTPLDSWFIGRLACPWDRAALALADRELACPRCERRFPVIDGIPVLLRDDVDHPHTETLRSIRESRAQGAAETTEPPLAPGEIDPHVQEAIAATGGFFYRPLMGKLKEYPIPQLRLPEGGGRALLDLGCNWGRWTIAATRRGYTAVGLDPQLHAVRAARRVARQLGVPARFVVADARYIPFVDGTFDASFSYSVLQHLPKEDVAAALREVKRVLRPGGTTLIQMPNVFGVRCLYHQAKRGFRAARQFEVRYWTPGELRQRFGELVGPAELSVDGYFSLNPQPAEAHLLPLKYRAIVATSEALRKASAHFPPLLWAADSIYVKAVKPA